MLTISGSSWASVLVHICAEIRTINADNIKGDAPAKGIHRCFARVVCTPASNVSNSSTRAHKYDPTPVPAFFQSRESSLNGVHQGEEINVEMRAPLIDGRGRSADKANWLEDSSVQDKAVDVVVGLQGQFDTITNGFLICSVDAVNVGLSGWVLATNTSTCMANRSAGYLRISAVSSGDWDLESVTTAALNVSSRASVTARPMPLVEKILSKNIIITPLTYFDAPVTITTGFCVVVAMLEFLVNIGTRRIDGGNILWQGPATYRIGWKSPTSAVRILLVNGHLTRHGLSSRPLSHFSLHCTSPTARTSGSGGASATLFSPLCDGSRAQGERQRCLSTSNFR